jgi:hypothetical protein
VALIPGTHTKKRKHQDWEEQGEERGNKKVAKGGAKAGAKKQEEEQQSRWRAMMLGHKTCRVP